MGKYYQYIIGAVIGAVIVFLLIGRVPDVKYEHDTVHHTEFSHSTSTVYVTNNAQITGGTNATIQPNGNIVVSGTNLSISSTSSTASTSVLDTASTTVSAHSEKTTTYNGSIFALWEPFALKPYPSVIGFTYLIVNPVALVVEYHLIKQEVYAGGELKF